MKRPPASRALVHRTALVLLLLALAAPATAQTATSYDLAPEDGGWIHTHVVEVDGQVAYSVQDGLTLVSAQPGIASLEGTTVTINATPAATVTLRFAGPAHITVPTAGPAPLTIRTTAAVDAPREPASHEGGVYTFEAQPGETYTVQDGTGPADGTVTVTTTATPGPTATPAFSWTSLVLGLLAGILLWAFLVQRGMVQRRSRKQVVATAAHTAAAAEGTEMLQARRRTLMAALKDLEKAKMNKEVPVDVYDRLKAELKKDTVTVMRAIEAAETK